MLRNPEMRADCWNAVVIQSFFHLPVGSCRLQFVFKPFGELAVQIKIMQGWYDNHFCRNTCIDEKMPGGGFTVKRLCPPHYALNMFR